MESDAVLSEQELALHAIAVRGLTSGPRVPGRWNAPAFLRELGLVRGHLSVIHSRPLLAASFERESVRDGVGRPTLQRARSRLRVSAVHVAYALRWLELGDEPRPSEVAARPLSASTSRR